MAKRRKLFKTKVVVEILSEDAPINENWSLASIEYEITHGRMIGWVTVDSARRITGKQMAKECRRMDSIPDFFDLDDNGKTIGR
jgi:hypothetical protein